MLAISDLGNDKRVIAHTPSFLRPLLAYFYIWPVTFVTNSHALDMYDTSNFGIDQKA